MPQRLWHSACWEVCCSYDECDKKTFRNTCGYDYGFLHSALCFAAGQTELRDDAELFTSEEETQLQAELDAFVQKTGWVAVIYTNNEGKTEDNIKPFANRYYADKYGKTTAGVILTIDMEGRAIDFRTKGDAMYYFGDGRVNTLLDDVQYDMKQGNYYSAAEQFLYYVDHYYDEGIDDDKSNKNIDLQEKRIINSSMS